MPAFSVDTQVVYDTAARARARVDTIQAEVSAMASDIASLETAWTGGAAASMSACATDWQLTQIQVQNSLSAIGVALDQSALSYDDVESANTSRFGPTK